MEPITTNIFCLIGKPGSGRDTILKSVLNQSEFIEKNNINKFIYGTTRPMNSYDIDGESYHFMSNDEFENLDPTEIIESRSYDNIYTNQIYYYFTLNGYIKFGLNYIGKVSTFQYSELKKWAFLSQLKNTMVRINIYPIVINAPIFEREKRLMNKASTDEDVYNMCNKLITEKYEFKLVIEKNPEIIDYMNPNTCILDNGKSGKQNIALLTDKVEKFILNRLTMQGLK